MDKLIAVVRRPGSAGLAPPIVDGLRGCALHVPIDGEPSADPSVAAVWTLWVDDVAGCDLSRIDVGYLVEERLQWDYEQSWKVGEPSPGVKRITFLRAAAGISPAEFAAHWSDIHTPLARRHHPALWRYAQNIVRSPLTPDAPPIEGVAELSFRSLTDLRDHMYDSEEGRRIVATDVASFIDVAAGWRVLTEERVLLSPPNSNTF